MTPGPLSHGLVRPTITALSIPLRPSAANSTATSSRPCLRPGFGRGAFYNDGAQ